MALLVATAGNGSQGPGTGPARQAKGSGPSESAVHISPGPGLLWSARSSGSGGERGGGTTSGTAKHSTTTTTVITTTTTTPHPSAGTAQVATTRLAAGTTGAGSAPQATAPSATATTIAPAPTTTTTTDSPAVPADRTQTQGYLNPPTEPSNKFGFTGTGAMEISVIWSGNTYLTMQVSCPNGGQSVGGTAAMAASLPDASGSCLATVTEPTSETTTLTYTISIGPAGG
jgi:hypothetical protein